MATHKELQDRQKQLDIDKAAAKKDAIADINEKIEFYGITSKDLKLIDSLKPEVKIKPKQSSKTKTPYHNKVGDEIAGNDPKYKTWSGQGREPQWLKDLVDSGYNKDELKIPDVITS